MLELTVAVADDTLDTEVVDGRHLSRDVIVLKVLRHLRKPTADKNNSKIFIHFSQLGYAKIDRVVLKGSKRHFNFFLCTRSKT